MTLVDPRLYILGSLLLLFIIVLVYLFLALRRYRHAVRTAGMATPAVAEDPRFASEPATRQDRAGDGLGLGKLQPEQVLSSPLRTGDWMPQPEVAPAPMPAPELEQPVIVADTPEYRLVSPVELQFTMGEGRVGVRRGTTAFGEFQRLAGLLLADVADSRYEPRS